MVKRIVLGTALLAVLGAGLAYRSVANNAAQAKVNDESAAAFVERGPIRQEVSCSGAVVSNLDVEIKCKATGQITALPYDISDTVAKDDLLLQIDPVDEERSVRQAQVRLASAEAKLARAKQSLAVSEGELKNGRAEAQANLRAAKATSQDMRDKARRMAELQQKQYASPEDAGSAEAAAVQAESSFQKAAVGVEAIKVDEERLELLRQDIKLAEADVESIRIDLENAQQRLTETKVYAPMAGVISDRMVQVGQIIASPTMNVGGGTALLTLSDLSRIFVLASVDESDVGQVRQGQRAMITVDAFPDERFRGEVVRVATKGAKLSNVVTFEVKIEVLDEQKQKLLPEMTADVEILVASKEDALTVPSQAVQRRGPAKVVLTPAAGGAEPVPVPVETGIDDGDRIEITAGLEEGQSVLVNQDSGAGESKGRQGGPRPGPFGGGPPGPPPM